MSIQLITISKSDQDQALPVLIPVAPEQLTVMGPVSLKPRHVGPEKISSSRLVVFPQPNSEQEKYVESLAVYLSSKTAHLLDKPQLPPKETLNTWGDNWSYLSGWVDVHPKSCVIFNSGKRGGFSRTPSALPRFIMQRIMWKNGFGLLHLAPRGLNSKEIMTALTNHCPDHSINISGDWNPMIYAFFHVTLGKLYIGSSNRTDGKGWAKRSQEHFSDALKMSTGSTPKEMCFVLRTSSLSDWRIFALQRLELSQPCSAIEGSWIVRLRTMQPYGFNGCVKTTPENSVIENIDAFETIYIPRIMQTLERHRNTLRKYTAPHRYINETVKDVTNAFASLRLELQQQQQLQARTRLRFLTPLP